MLQKKDKAFRKVTFKKLLLNLSVWLIGIVLFSTVVVAVVVGSVLCLLLLGYHTAGYRFEILRPVVVALESFFLPLNCRTDGFVVEIRPRHPWYYCQKIHHHGGYAVQWQVKALLKMREF